MEPAEHGRNSLQIEWESNSSFSSLFSGKNPGDEVEFKVKATIGSLSTSGMTASIKSVSPVKPTGDEIVPDPQNDPISIIISKRGK